MLCYQERSQQCRGPHWFCWFWACGWSSEFIQITLKMIVVTIITTMTTITNNKQNTNNNNNSNHSAIEIRRGGLRPTAMPPPPPPPTPLRGISLLSALGSPERRAPGCRGRHVLRHLRGLGPSMMVLFSYMTILFWFFVLYMTVHVLVYYLSIFPYILFIVCYGISWYSLFKQHTQQVRKQGCRQHSHCAFGRHWIQPVASPCRTLQIKDPFHLLMRHAAPTSILVSFASRT